MPIQISAWATNVDLKSPNGRITATISAAWEIGMGAPTCGKLVLSNGLSYDNCNPSMVWSDDSEYLAVPQWQFEQHAGANNWFERILVISIQRRKAKFASGDYELVELCSFTDGIIEGVKLPKFQPERVVINTRGIFEN